MTELLPKRLHSRGCRKCGKMFAIYGTVIDEYFCPRCGRKSTYYRFDINVNIEDVIK